MCHFIFVIYWLDIISDVSVNGKSYWVCSISLAIEHIDVLKAIFWFHHRALVCWRCSKFMTIMLSNFTDRNRKLTSWFATYQTYDRTHSPISLRKDNFNDNLLRHMKRHERCLQSYHCICPLLICVTKT